MNHVRTVCKSKSDSITEDFVLAAETLQHVSCVSQPEPHRVHSSLEDCAVLDGIRYALCEILYDGIGS